MQLLHFRCFPPALPLLRLARANGVWPVAPRWCHGVSPMWVVQPTAVAVLGGSFLYFAVFGGLGGRRQVVGWSFHLRVSNCHPPAPCKPPSKRLFSLYAPLALFAPVLHRYCTGITTPSPHPPRCRFSLHSQLWKTLSAIPPVFPRSRAHLPGILLVAVSV